MKIKALTILQFFSPSPARWLVIRPSVGYRYKHFNVSIGGWFRKYEDYNTLHSASDLISVEESSPSVDN